MTSPLVRVYNAIDALVDYAVDYLALDPRDTIWKRNQIFEIFGFNSYGSPELQEDIADDEAGATAEFADLELVGNGKDILADAEEDLSENTETSPVNALLAEFKGALEEAQLLEVGAWGAVADQVMGMLSLSPSAVQDLFSEVKHAQSGASAMQWFYDYCVSNDYVKRAQLAANPRFTAENGLIVTINLAKPEFKDTKKAAAGNAVAGGYPKCTICPENEGFAGRDKRTLRTVPVTLGGQDWFWQYSPYGYFDQHGICVNTAHTPMHVDRGTFTRLLDFVDEFPNYFLGSNAALPRIGGSVLAHDHYQGGGEILPMLKADAWVTLRHPDFSDAIVEVLDWPGTAVRIVSENRDSIIGLGDIIRVAWEEYRNSDLGIINYSEAEGKHSVVSPTAIKTDRGYEMNIIFRNNVVTEEYPEGLFHAHPEFHPIKQESIGLIEAQGLFILPGRLVNQLKRIADALAAGESLPAELSEFQLVWDELVDSLNGVRDREVIDAALREELGSICYRILENTAVFKDKEITKRFLADLNIIPN